MNEKQKNQCREELRQWISKWTLCDIQTGKVNGKDSDFGWTCGTCFMNLLNELGLDETKPEYKECNKPRDRHNEVWRALLQIRDADYKDE